MGTLRCPRCRRTVENTPEGRRAHGVSCVRIPRVLPKGWGIRREDR